MPEAVTLLNGLKIELGITTTAYDDRLVAYLFSAQKRIETEGITLDDNYDDSTLTIQYAAWMWRCRDSGVGMPRMLRYALNNRLFSEKMKDGT
jgi:hypothetical protein